MNKVITAILCCLVIFSAIFVGMRYDENRKKQEIEQKQNNVQNSTEISEKVTDECTDEWEQLQEESKLEILQANSGDIKVSPNCDFILKTYYKGCKHISQEYVQLPESIINKTEDEVKALYAEWQIETFTANQVVLYRELDGECNEHYILKEQDGKITVYTVDENGEEIEFMKTDVAVEYLTETDKIHLADGWKVYGRESLNQVIEDFE